LVGTPSCVKKQADQIRGFSFKALFQDQARDKIKDKVKDRHGKRVNPLVVARIFYLSGRRRFNTLNSLMSFTKTKEGREANLVKT
jgi:hypothetical protein